MNNKVIKKSIFCVTCIFFTMSFLGCSSQFFPFNAQPEITKAEFYPKYICAEEPTVTFTWEGRNFERLEILKNTGEPLLVLRSKEGTVTTPPITPDILPLQANAYLREKIVSHPVELVNIDQPTWTMPYPSTSENGGELESEFSRVEQESIPEGAYKTVKIFDLFQEFDSFTWQVPSNDFSEKAVLTKIKNASEFTLIISGRGIKKRVIKPNTVIDVPKASHPAGEWVLRFIQPEKRKVGEQRGDTEEGITITDIPRTAYLQFYVRNKEISSLATKNR